MPSSSSSEASSSAAPTRKRKQTSDSSSDENSTDEDTPQPLPVVPVTERTVLSHAERRRQKKKEKQQEKPVTATPHKKRKLADGTADPSNPPATSKPTSTTDAPRRQQRQHSVWVGNLSFRTRRDALLGFFDGVGTITRVHMPMRRGMEVQGENMGFAYVDFDTPEAKTTAITLSEGQLDGRHLLIKDGGDFTGRPDKVKTSDVSGDKPVKDGTTGMTDGKGLSKMAQRILRLQKQPPGPTLFLGNLGFETTEESIRELFEAHRYSGTKGKEKGVEGLEQGLELEQEAEDGSMKSKDVWIRKIRMGTFEDSGACKGFAFVDFTRIEHATAALVNPRNHRLNGRDLVVEYASPDAVRRGGGPRKIKDKKSLDGNTRTPQKDFADSLPHTKRPRPHVEQEDGADVTVDATTPWSHRPDHAGHGRPYTRRAKPGAALAHAQRQSVAILPSQGNKIVF